MGLTKNYLRFVHECTFGLVAASRVGASIRFLQMRDTTDRFVAVPANENIYIWDLKTKDKINEFVYNGDNAAEVTVFDCYYGGHARTNLIAVGYANGHVRVFEYETGLLKVSFTGHRTAISALAFDKDGSRLASGGKDCNIVLWDIINEKGLFSLLGHKNSLSKLCFLYNEEHQKDLLVSSSVDAITTIKFWDLQTQHCFCSIPGQANGVWSFIIVKSGTRLITGSHGPELKVFSIKFLSEVEKGLITQSGNQKSEFEDEIEAGSSALEYGIRVEPMGNILRNSNTVSNRVSDIVTDTEEKFILCHSIDKNIEIYGMRTRDEALTYAKKQAKKANRRQAKRKTMNEDVDEDMESDSRITISSLEDLTNPQSVVDCEFNRKFGCQRLDDKIKAVAITKTRTNKDGLIRFKVAVMSSSNKIDSFLLEPEAEDKSSLLRPFVNIMNYSHRTDVRGLSISPDNSLIVSSSAESVKVWRLDSRSCLATIETGGAMCCEFANAQNIASNYENRFILLGTKQGELQIIDISDTKVIKTYNVTNNCKPLNSICVLPNRIGIICGGEDGVARIYNFVWHTSNEDGQKKTELGIDEDRILQFPEGITCINVSPNNKLMAVALLDSTVRVHFLDTFKYFLTMYGHKFPVTTMDISDDSNLLATGSPDKNIKIWGLDFGDCHKSIFAHDDAITCVKFVPKTHYIFSCGRDKSIKQWDCDHFIKIQTLRGHQGEIWCLSLSSNGKYLVTGSHDRSIRLYRKTEEILVPTEEEETERELEDERNVFEKQENIVVGEVTFETGFAAKMTIDSVKSADRLIEAIDVFTSEHEKLLEYNKQCEAADSKGEPRPPEPEHDPLLMSVMTTDYQRYILEILRRIKSSELEEILITLPFDYVRKLLMILVILLEKRWDVELMVRCATFLLRVNFGQIASSSSLVPTVYKLKAIIMERTVQLRDCAGFNLMALEHISQNKKYISTKTTRDKMDRLRKSIVQIK